jgi:hypothetical protein
MNPNTSTAPIFRTAADAELTARIHARVPVLINESKGNLGNPWGLSFMAMFHMANDSGLFRNAAQLADAGFVRIGADWTKQQNDRPVERLVPLYEAKLANFFDHRASSYGNNAARGYRVLPPTSLMEHTDSNFEVEPFYWVPERAVNERLQLRTWKHNWLLCWRDITHATNERTLIATAIPSAGCGDTLLLMFPTQATAQQAAALLCNLCSLVTDYLVRQKIGGLHLKYNVIKQIPILPSSSYGADDLAFITPRVVELTYSSHSMAPFARDLGFNGLPFRWDEERRAHLRAELDAWYARAYGLTRDELRYILDPADVKGPDYPSETFRVLKANEIRRFGEYRTARLVLQAWDAMEREARGRRSLEIASTKD